MTIEPFGKLEYNKSTKEWVGLVDNICPNNKVELKIAVDNIDVVIAEKIELLKQLTYDYKMIVEKLYDLAYKKYENTEFEASREEIENMYFLSGLSLKKDNRTWWLVLEPHFNVTSIYNHILRFTMLDRKLFGQTLK